MSSFESSIDSARRLASVCGSCGTAGAPVQSALLSRTNAIIDAVALPLVVAAAASRSQFFAVSSTWGEVT